MLARFVTLALDQNLDLAQAAARVAQARASLRQADVALLPSANLSAQGAKIYQSVETPLGQVLSAAPGFDRSASQYETNLMNQTEGSLTQAEAQIPVLEAGLDAAMNALDVLLAVPLGTHRTKLAATGRVPVAPGLAETGTPAEMIRRRPDLIVAERRLAAANARIGVAISDYYPKFPAGERPQPTIHGCSPRAHRARQIGSRGPVNSDRVGPRPGTHEAFM